MGSAARVVNNVSAAYTANVDSSVGFILAKMIAYSTWGAIVSWAVRVLVWSTGTVRVN